MFSLPPPAVLLLDVDGVLNVERPGWPDADKRGTVHADGRDWQFRWSPSLIAGLVDLFYLDLVEIRWCSTWCPEADKLHLLWETPAFPACWTEPLPSGQHVNARKLACARDILAQGRRLIWADDEAIPTSKERRALGMAGDALYLRPHPRTGLSPAHLDQISLFATKPYKGD